MTERRSACILPFSRGGHPASGPSRGLSLIPSHALAFEGKRRTARISAQISASTRTDLRVSSQHAEHPRAAAQVQPPQLRPAAHGCYPANDLASTDPLPTSFTGVPAAVREAWCALHASAALLHATQMGDTVLLGAGVPALAARFPCRALCAVPSVRCQAGVHREAPPGCAGSLEPGRRRAAAPQVRNMDDAIWGRQDGFDLSRG
jgi:hypothetical protein